MHSYRARLTAALLALIASACSTHPGSSDAGPKDAGVDAGVVDGGIDAGPMCSFAVHQGQGLPCNRDGDCTTGRCYVPLTGGGYCTTTCSPGTSGSCVSGYECISAADRGDNACARSSGTSAPVSPLPFGSPCNQDSDCAGEGALCDTVLNASGLPYSFCTRFCEEGQSRACGECGACVSPPQGGSSECMPTGNGALGTQCDQNSDCGSFYCRGFCTVLCSSGGNVIDCPEGTVCRSIVANGQQFGLCMTNAQLGGTQAGGPCTFDLECASGSTCHISPGADHGTCLAGTNLGTPCTTDNNCASGLVCRPVAPGLRRVGQSPDPDKLVCTHDCLTPCGSSATCVALDLDTNLRLYQDQSGTPQIVTLPSTASDVNPTFGNRWSAFTKSLTAGTYWIEVKAYHQAFGQYVLEISDGVHAEGQTGEAAGGNGTTGTAQTVVVPTSITGSFEGPGDLDYYKFTLGSDATLTVKTARGPGSACLPTSATGQVQWGDACTTDYECASGLCEQSIQVCGETCTRNSECGGVDPAPDAGPVDAGDPADAGDLGDAGPVDGGDAGDQNPTAFDAGPPAPICADFQTHRSCVRANAHAELPTGSDCHYSFECERGYCADYNGSVFCTQTCAGPTARCSVGMNGNQCILQTISPSGEPVSDYACVPTH